MVWPWMRSLADTMHSEKFKMNEEVDSFLSEKVSDLLLTWKVNSIKKRFCKLDVIHFKKGKIVHNRISFLNGNTSFESVAYRHSNAARLTTSHCAPSSYRCWLIAYMKIVVCTTQSVQSCVYRYTLTAETMPLQCTIWFPGSQSNFAAMVAHTCALHRSHTHTYTGPILLPQPLMQEVINRLRSFYDMNSGTVYNQVAAR